MNLIQLASQTQTPRDAYDFAITYGLIGIYKHCPNCFRICTLTKRNLASCSGLTFDCSACHYRFSAFLKTIFYHSKLSIQKILLIAYCFAYKFNLQQAKQETQTSEQTISSFYSIFRKYCENWNAGHQIGGIGTIVECDETFYARQKYHVGHLPTSQVWVVGGICRETKEMFLKRVPNRSTATLQPLLLLKIVPGTLVITDKWRAYNFMDLPPSPFAHFTVNHSKNFVDPLTGAHTQTIERSWIEVKMDKLLSRGIPVDLIDSHLEEFMWRRSVKLSGNDKFEMTLKLLKSQLV
jgi:transposase-like protein